MFGKLIPTWTWLAAIAALSVLLGLSHMGMLREKTRFSNYKAEAERIARVASEEHRRIETVRQSNVDKEVANAQPLIAAEVRDSGVARVDVRVRDAATRYVYRACPNPKPATASAPAADSGLLLADLFSKLDARAGELAELAGQRGAAGALCERAFDALTVKP